MAPSLSLGNPFQWMNWGYRSTVDPGLALLANALGWFSTQEQTVVTRTSTPLTPGATSALTVVTGQPDPWGGTTAVAYQSTATTAAHWARWDTTGLAVGEEWTVSLYLKPANASALSNQTRLFPNATSVGVDIFTTSATEVFALWAAGAAVRPRIVEQADGWYYVEMSFVADASNQHYICLQSNSSVLGTGTTDLWITPPVFTRTEVSAITNRGAGAAVATQATASARPVARPRWGALQCLHFDGEACVMPITAVPAAWSGVGTALSFGCVIEPIKPSTARGTVPTEGAIFRLAGSTASMELRLTTAGVLTLRLTDDAATATVATLPVTVLRTKQVLYVVRTGASVQLYVQGVALGAAQTIGAGAATFTSCELGGTTLSAKLTEATFHAGVLTATQVRDASNTLAARCGFSTATVPLWFGVSQSNGLASADVSDFPAGEQASAPYSLLRSFASTDTLPETTDWGPVRPRIGDGAVGATNRAYSENAGAGTSYQWGMTQTLGRIATCHYGRNGTEIAEFLSTGSLWAEQLTYFQDAIADLVAGGIPYSVAGLVLVFGENDSVDVTRANAFTTKVEQLRTDLQTALGVTFPAIVQPRVSNLLTTGTYPQRDLLRANEVTWQAANPVARVLIDIDGLPLKVDNVHWSSATCLEAGKRIGASSPRVV